MSTFILVISTILLFASFLSFSISVVDGYLLIAVMQCLSILLRYLIKESSLQLFISSFLFPYSLGLLISANLFIKKSYFFQEDILSNKYIRKTAIIISLLFFINFLIKTYASTFSTDDLLGQTNFALSTQSPFFYSLQGIITQYCNAYLYAPISYLCMVEVFFNIIIFDSFATWYHLSFNEPLSTATINSFGYISLICFKHDIKAL